MSEWATANLDLDKKFISVIPENKINDIKFVEETIIENREYSINNRDEILHYAKQFEWCRMMDNYFLANIQKVIYGQG